MKVNPLSLNFLAVCILIGAVIDDPSGALIGGLVGSVLTLLVGVAQVSQQREAQARAAAAFIEKQREAEPRAEGYGQG